MNTVFIVDDDVFLTNALAGVLGDLGLSCTTFGSVAKIEGPLKGPAPDAMLVDLALPVQGSTLLDKTEARGGYGAGIALLRLAKQSWPSTLFGLITGGPSADAREWCEENGIAYLLKPISRSTLERFLRLRPLKAFVVHGRNMSLLEDTKTLLAALNIESVVLMEQPNKGRTVIEKFEEVSASCDCAVVVMSPDDVGRLADEPINSEQFRIRQNVLFELGYFCGELGRRSGRVILIEFGDIEIPSDLAGVVRVNGQGDLAVLQKQVEEELAHLLL